MPTVLITGANRGIGLSFVKAYKHKGWNVLATARNPSEAIELNKIQGVKIYPLDISNKSSIQELSKSLKDTPLDLLINNAGIYLREDGWMKKALSGELDVSDEDLLNTYRVNAMGPFMVSLAFLPNLNQASSGSASETKKIVSITSQLGSIADNSSGGSYGYRASKCALNNLAKTMAVDLKHAGSKIAIILLHPGYVTTDMTSHKGNVEPQEAVEKLVQVIDKCGLEDSGKFFDRFGEVLPW